MNTTKILATTIAATTLLAAQAADNDKTPLFTTPKLNGFFIGQYQYSSQKNSETNTFNVRMLRLTLSGRILNDFAYSLQVQANGNTEKLGDSPRLLDASLEWQKLPYLRIKGGQFKLPFTFDNASNPIDVGFTNFSQGRQKLVGASDRIGSRASNGRDIGVQIQGDLLKSKNSNHTWLHYQVGVFNGQGTNTKDVDNQKDIVGGIWLSPTKGLRLGAFGWTGSYAREGTLTLENGNTTDATVKLKRNRYAFGAEYTFKDYLFRSEYIHSTGYGFKTTANKDNSETDLTVNTNAGNKADAFYLMASIPFVKQKAYVRARYDLYRARADWATSKTQYELQIKYILHRHLIFFVEYALVNDRTLAHTDYSLIDTQLVVRF